MFYASGLPGLPIIGKCRLPFGFTEHPLSKRGQKPREAGLALKALVYKPGTAAPRSWGQEPRTPAHSPPPRAAGAGHVQVSETQQPER